MTKRIYFTPDNMDEILTYFPHAFSVPATNTEPSEANIMIGAVGIDLQGLSSNYLTWGYKDQQFLERKDEDIPRICCYLANWETDLINGSYIPYLDIDDVSPDFYGRIGLAISDGTNNNISNLVSIKSGEDRYITYVNSTEGDYGTADRMYNERWQHVNPGPSSLSTPVNAIYPGLSGRGNNRASLTIEATIPIFINKAAARNYIDTGAIEPNTCFNRAEDFDTEDIHSFIRSWTYKYDDYKNYVSHDAGKHKLNIYTNGNTIVGYVNEGDYYNIKLVAEGNHTMTWTTLDGGSYSGDADTFNASHAANNYNTYNQYKRYGRNEYVKGGWWDTNIYIYKDKADAEAALEDPDSVIPINVNDLDDYPDPGDTGSNTDTEADLTSQSYDGATGLITLYESSAGALIQLGGALYTPSQSLLDSLKIYGESPINALISVHHCPIDLSSFLVKESASGFKLGSHDVTTTGVSTITHYGKLVAIADTLINPVYNDFRDYTNLSYELHLPFSNPISLEAREIVGKTLTIKASVDPYVLQLRYYIIINSVVSQIVDTNIGRSIAVLGNDAAGKAKEMRQDMLNLTQSGASIAMGVATGNAVGAVSGGISALGGIYSVLEHEKSAANKQIVGSFASGCAESDILYPYLVIIDQQSVKPPMLESVYGRPTNLVTTLGQLRGLTCAEMPQLEVDCSEAEREEIISAISEGVIL